MNLLMIGGDTTVVRGQQGAFHNTLTGFAPYWEKVDILTLRVANVTRYDCFGNVTFYPSPWPKALQPLFIWRKGHQLATARKYHLIVSHDYGLFLNGLGADWLSRTIGVPYVSEIHHVEGYPRAANLRERLQPWLTRQYVRRARRRAAGFRITNRAELKPLLESWGVASEQLHLLYSLYLDFEVFQPVAAPLDFDAVFCGRLTPNKHPLLFVEGVARARDQLGRMRALIVGQGPLEGAVLSRAAALGLSEHLTHSPWVGTQAELADLFRRSRCLVCTSLSEGGPRVVGEALACGVPVVTTRVGLAHELVRDGENGYQIDWSAQELAGRLTQIASDAALRARLSAQAPAAVRRYEKSRVIQAYALGFKQLAAQ